MTVVLILRRDRLLLWTAPSLISRFFLSLGGAVAISGKRLTLVLCFFAAKIVSALSLFAT